METPKPSRNWFHIPIQLTVAAFAVYWHWHIPPPNKAVLFLAGVAAIMALVEMRPIHKAIYFLLIVALMFIENRTIDKDRRDFANAEAYRRKEENQQFSKIGDSITTNIQRLLEQSDQQFQATLEQQSDHFDAAMKTAKVNIDDITGGDSYVVVYPDLTPNGKNVFPLMVGLCPNCQYSVPDAYIYLQTDVNVAGAGTLLQHETVASNFFNIVLPTTITGSTTSETAYKITVLARNKPTVEILKLRFNAKTQEWECSWNIMRTEKVPHFNPKTKMAEGMVMKTLQDMPWISNSSTLLNPAKTTIRH